MDDKNINEALKPGQTKVLPQFKDLPKLSEFDKLQLKLKKLNTDVKFYKEMVKDWKKVNMPSMVKAYQSDLNTSEKDLAKVKAKLAKTKNKPEPGTIDSLVSFLMKTSGNYIKEMKKANMFLYRGMHEGKNVIHGRSCLDREPKDSSYEEQLAYDQLLTKLKIKAKRSNSIFATSKPSFAANYGDLYLIFPYNSAVFSWSAKVKDLVLEPGDIIDSYIIRNPASVKKLDAVWVKALANLDKIEDQMVKKGTLSDEENRLYDLIDDLRAPNHIQDLSKRSHVDLDDSINEAVQTLKQIAAFKITAPMATTMINVLNKYKSMSKAFTPESLAKFQKAYSISDKNFTAALKFKGEILISGEYIAVNATQYGPRLGKALGIKFNPVSHLDW